MNQIPNIEGTHNTREVEEIVEEFKEIYGDYLTGYFCCNGRECGCNGTEVDTEAYCWLRTTLHHQLQKAREEAAEEIISDYMEALGTVQLPKEVWLWIADINGKYLNKTIKENI